MTTNKNPFKEPGDVALFNELRMIVLRLHEAEELVKDLRAQRNDIAVTLVNDYGRSVRSVAMEAQMTRVMLAERRHVAAVMAAYQTAPQQSQDGPVQANADLFTDE